MTEIDEAGRGPVVEWFFPPAAALGSDVRLLRIAREIAVRLPFPERWRLDVEFGRVAYRVPDEEGWKERLAVVVDAMAEALPGLGDLPVLPREVEEILAVTAPERLRWTRDGRLRSAGTRTVKFPGRTEPVTFYVYDPGHIEDALDRDLAALWREADAQEAAEARRRAAGKAALQRAGKGETPAEDEAQPKPRPRAEADADLDGWTAFEANGFLR